MTRQENQNPINSGKSKLGLDKFTKFSTSDGSNAAIEHSGILINRRRHEKNYWFDSNSE